MGAVVLSLLAVPVAGGSTASAAASARHRSPSISQEQAEALAVKKAQATGDPVEVMADRTETRQVMAQPDGTLVSDESLSPRWIKGADGTWQAVDAKLAVTPDGRVAPKTLRSTCRCPRAGRLLWSRAAILMITRWP